MQSLKYSEESLVFLQNFSVGVNNLDYTATYFLIAGQNVNSSIAFAYWYGTASSKGIQQYTASPCDPRFFGPCVKRDFTAAEIMEIVTSLDVATGIKFKGR